MEHVTPFTTDDDLVAYSKALATRLFSGIYRKTGLPYTTNHLEKMASTASDILNQGPYFKPAIATAWLHDVVEDISGFDVQAPPRDLSQKDSDTIFLNTILENAGADGEAACYLVDKLTHRKEVSYIDYFSSIFDFSDQSPLKNLNVVAAVLKLIDRFLNTNPDETPNVDTLLTAYRNLDWNDEDVVRSFLKKTKTYDAFADRGDFSKDETFFAETLKGRFRSQQEAIAIDNLSLYLPFAEQKLLMSMPVENGLFDWHKLRRLLKQAYLDSLELYPGFDPFHIVLKLGANKKRVYPNGYMPLLVEINKEKFS